MVPQQAISKCIGYRFDVVCVKLQEVRIVALLQKDVFPIVALNESILLQSRQSCLVYHFSLAAGNQILQVGLRRQPRRDSARPGRRQMARKTLRA